MPSRWDYLLDQKPRGLEDHLLDEVARRLAQDLARFPPPIDGFGSAADQARFQPLFDEPTRPAADVYRLAFKLARMELAREIEAVDEFMRNERWRPSAPTPRDYLAMVFLWRWLTEQMLSLSEAVRTRLTRAKLADCLDRTEWRLFVGLAHAGSPRM